jgi:V8-like Glu-specific endopeptidase
MKRILASGALVACLAAFAAAPAALAITNGGPDGSGHPEVGALLAQQAFSDGTWEECTGTLISPTVFLTAAHCDEGVSRVAVSFDSTYVPGRSTTYWGTWHANPGYNQTNSDPGDIAVIVLDKPVKGITPARLPAAHSLDAVDTTTQFTSVGYGGQAVTNGPGGKTIHYQDVRYVATGTLNSVTTSWLRISQNASTGNGGTCYGDSGGPNFLGAGASETNIVAGTTISGDSWCRSTNVDYRMDTDSARSFLATYVSLP